MFHIASAPSKIPGVCDNCGGSLEQRKDDSEEVISKRLAVYHEQTAPLVEYYSAKGLLQSLDASASMDAVEKKIFAST